jgi:Ca2+-binding RTX toxin-like protein
MTRKFESTGGRGDDHVLGSAARNWLRGHRDNDQPDRDGGNDLLYHGAAAHQLDGNDGDDQLDGGCGDDELSGGAGNDQLYGGRGRDSLSGGDGDDWLHGDNGDDRLHGEAGNDQLDGGRGDDQLEGGTGNDELVGDAGDDLFVYRNGDGNDYVDGGDGSDVLRLEVGNDWVLNLDRGEVVSREDGRIQLSAGAAGTITLADGSTIRFDRVERLESIAAEPTPGNQAPGSLGLAAGPIDEGASDGTVVGTLVAVDPDAGDTLTYALTDDADGRFAIDPSTGVITVADGARLDYETAAAHSIGVRVTDAGGLSAIGAFTVGVADVNEAPTVLDLSSARVVEGVPDGTVVGTVAAADPDAGDTLTYALTDDADGRFAIDPTTGVITVADGSRLDYETDAQHSIGVAVTDGSGLRDEATWVIEVTFDNGGDNVLTGDDGDNVVDGGLGNDRITGLAGNDHLIGGDGADELDGGLGDDVLEGGAHDDLLVGGDGADQLDGGDGADLVFGNDGNDQLSGGAGNDQLFGGRDRDLLDGGDGDDLLQASVGNDVLRGGAGKDTLFGSIGADTLAGGPGDDTLSGGSEADRFVFTSIEDGLDVIVDFRADDVLAIGDMLVGFAPGNEAAFVNLVDDGTDTTVQVDPDGAANGVAFTSIAVLEGVTGMTLTDLVNAGQIDFWLS